jgi:DNA polymerase-1
MVRIHERLKSEKYASKMILQVHDELIFEVEPGELDRLREMVVNEMSGAAKLDVPLKVDVGTGSNWLEAH